MEELSRKLAEMAINLIQAQGTGPTFHHHQPAPHSRSHHRTHSGDGLRSGRCFICGKEGEELDHSLHPSRCKLTPGLLTDGLMIFNLTKNRYLLPNGEELPLVPGYPGGVAAYLRTVAKARAEATTGKDTTRDPPPHMESSSSNQVQIARTNSIGLTYGNKDILHGNVFAVTALPNSTYASNPSLRSGKDTSSRFNPMERPDDKSKKPAVSAPHPNPTSVPQAPKPLPPTPTIPPPSNSINRKDGWRASLPSNQNRTDVKMGDDTKKQAPGPQYHFTSDIQERATPADVFEDIMQTKISLPIFQLIGSSPQLQKLVGEATRTRRAYTSKQTGYSENAEDTNETGTHEYEAAKALYAENFDRLPEFLVYYSNAVAVSPQRKFFAMTTGSLRVQINGVDLSAMIDTGSELNLASYDVPDRTSCPVDFEGMKWSLRGIHGGPEQLHGVMTEAPVKIAGYDFPHHFFVSHNSVGKHDLILGQPFLQWYAARVDYERSGVVRMYLWKEGDRNNKPSLTISITDPADPRNATSIGHSHGATIEELEDQSGFHR